ncbi:MAG: DUF2809 domain-containing protein [Comamonadaceae bacterium]|nr:MAG: DUF2809 domain-containing protein [Comamonadaceae bacterium]
MTFRFNREALAWAILIFIVEVLIATVWSHHRLLRGFVGDLLAVVWVYYLFKVVVAASPRALALAAFGVGCLVELGQYLASANGWHIANPIARIVLGSVADWWDVAAYACGAITALAMERLLKQARPAA